MRIKKLRKWLIHALGGYTERRITTVVPMPKIEERQIETVKLTARTVVPMGKWVDFECPGDIDRHIREELAKKLAQDIVELCDYTVTPSCDTYQMSLLVIPTKKKRS